MRIKKYYAQTPNGWTEWVQPVKKGYRAACCDCGLVHEVEFRVYKPTGKIQFRVRRHDRQTSLARRLMKKLQQVFIN